MRSKRDTHRAKRSGAKAVIAGAMVASMLATGAVAQARLPTPESGSAGLAAKTAVVAAIGTEGATEHVGTFRGFNRVEVKPATDGGGLSTVAVITLAGLGGIALAIPAAHVYRRRSPSRVANA
jgi:hypothetical protein